MFYTAVSLCSAIKAAREEDIIFFNYLIENLNITVFDKNDKIYESKYNCFQKCFAQLDLQPYYPVVPAVVKLSTEFCMASTN